MAGGGLIDERAKNIGRSDTNTLVKSAGSTIFDFSKVQVKNFPMFPYDSMLLCGKNLQYSLV